MFATFNKRIESTWCLHNDHYKGLVTVLTEEVSSSCIPHFEPYGFARIQTFEATFRGHAITDYN